MVCTHLKGSSVFVRLKNWLRALWKVRSVELIHKAEPTRLATISSDFPSVAGPWDGHYERDNSQTSKNPYPALWFKKNESICRNLDKKYDRAIKKMAWQMVETFFRKFRNDLVTRIVSLPRPTSGCNMPHIFEFCHVLNRGVVLRCFSSPGAP